MHAAPVGPCASRTAQKQGFRGLARLPAAVYTFHMKIEKISDNQIRCILTADDLAKRQLKLSELAYGSEKAKRLFRDMMQQAAFQYGFEAECTLVAGGAERFNSVKNALNVIPDDAIVGVHDGVRPFVTPSVIEEAYSTAEDKGSAVPVVDCADSVRIVSEDGCSNAPIDRSRVKLVQTPQVFRASILKQAYDVEFSPLFTDDASVVEHAGHKIYLTKGDVNNKKITYISDLANTHTSS